MLGRATQATAGDAPVQLLRWPLESDRRDRAAERPCLWLLPPGELPPVRSPGEDWIRLPADERDIAARLQRLAARARPGGELVVDADGQVVHAGRSILLPPIEAALLRVLAAAPGRLVTRAQLVEAGWSDAPQGRALDSRIHALRGRIGPLELVIHTVRGRGFVLAVSGDGPADRHGAPHRGRR
jgi:hypothetical protein